MEKTVEIKSCKNCGVQFEITDKDLEFYDKVSPVFGGTKYSIPTPTHCPDCRQQRRLAWRNESSLYRSTCSATGKPIITIYSPNKPYIVYDQKFWWSDKWDPIDYGRDFDFSKSFISQFKELQAVVPRCSLINGFNENTDYANHGWKTKDSYMCFGFAGLQNVLYGWMTLDTNNSIDLDRVYNSNNLYECINITNGFKCYYCYNCSEISESFYLVNSQNSSFCYGCVNQVNSKYKILNKQYSKEEYMIKVDFYNKNKKIFYKEFEELLLSVPYKYGTIVGSENSSGNFIYNSKNVHYCFDSYDGEDLKYCYEPWGTTDSYDLYIGGFNTFLNYEGHCIIGNNILFSNVVWGGSNLYYCDNILEDCNNCFGCIGIRKKEYCILNKQYTKEEYTDLVPKIIEYMKKTGEWGEFFSINDSPFGYNETVAYEYLPISKEYAEKLMYPWMSEEYFINIPEGIEKIDSKTLPEDINLIDDTILNKAILCEVSGKPFRVVKSELEFYRIHGLPIPSIHPIQRHIKRTQKRQVNKLRKRTCMCPNCIENNVKVSRDGFQTHTTSPVEFLTTYSPDRPENVYCEVCYNKEVYG